MLFFFFLFSFFTKLDQMSRVGSRGRHPKCRPKNLNTSNFLLVSNEERPQINSFRHSVENNSHSVLTWKD